MKSSGGRAPVWRGIHPLLQLACARLLCDMYICTSYIYPIDLYLIIYLYRYREELWRTSSGVWTGIHLLVHPTSGVRATAVRYIYRSNIDLYHIIDLYRYRVHPNTVEGWDGGCVACAQLLCDIYIYICISHISHIIDVYLIIDLYRYRHSSRRI